ncbi:MAG: hypothetical protein IPP36_09315 [Nitrosomonadales bacterium]|nr:hypothetical protein [Nitrosomonadales bacterium]
MELSTLVVGLCLPWLFGVVWLRAPWLRATGVTWPTLLGYGYLGGILLTTLVMRLLNALEIRLGFFSIGLALLLLTVAGAWLGRKEPWRIRRPGADWHSLAGWRKIVYAIVLAAIVIRLAGLGLEIMWRPLFPWDAWSQWATKARVWYELGHLAKFVPADIWLSGQLAGAYTDAAPHYPPAIPLIQVWMSYSLGRWDDTLMNLPWLLCAAALGLAFYGQARQWQVSPLFALMFTYFLLSLPILDVHVALAGYADLFMGAFYGLAAMAFFHWARKRDFWQGAMALLFGLGCILIKQPGIAWALTFLPALLIVFMPRAGLVGTSVLAAARCGSFVCSWRERFSFVWLSRASALRGGLATILAKHDGDGQLAPALVSGSGGASFVVSAASCPLFSKHDSFAALRCFVSRGSFLFYPCSSMGGRLHYDQSCFTAYGAHAFVLCNGAIPGSCQSPDGRDYPPKINVISKCNRSPLNAELTLSVRISVLHQAECAA